MLRRGRVMLGTMALNIMIFYGWILSTGEDTWLRGLGINFLQAAGLVFASIYTYRAFKRTTKKERNFWLLILIGLLIYLSGNLIWFYYYLNGGNAILSDMAYSLWLAAYCFFLYSLIYWIRRAKPDTFEGSYFFNILIFMITAASISIHFLIRPILTLPDFSVWNTIVTLAYPVVDLSLLFVITMIYYLIHNVEDKRVMLIIITGFFVHVLADSYSVYSGELEGYTRANVANFLWHISILLIGFAGYYVKENTEESSLTIENAYDKVNVILPYISTILLILLVAVNYNWDFNSLSTGLLVIVLLIIGRQLFVIKENYKLINEYRHLAYHDPLTGLNNRESFEVNLDNEMKKSGNASTALLLVDLDRFKVVNDTLGHQAGDYILVKISDYLQQILDCDAQVFRLGGDEFTIVLPNATENKCREVAEAILNKFKKPFLIYDHEIIVTASIGISMYPQNGETYEELFKYADAAMYLAKEGGKNGYRFYNDNLNQKMARRMRIESDLRRALIEEQFEVYYQPKVELKTKKMIGMEALLRWKHPDLGWISPGEFIPIAEETGQIVSIGEWVLKTACRQTKRWHKKGLPPLSISVNVSVRQFQHGDLLAIVREALYESNLNPHFLEIEVTESIMQNTKESEDILIRLRQMGIKIAIDDFGTGYSSLHVIQKLPIDTIKLDKSFIDDIGNANHQAMVKTIINMGKNLNLNVVAEGIETEYQLKKLIESKCPVGQGYLFSRAVGVNEFEKILSDNNFSELEQALTF